MTKFADPDKNPEKTLDRSPGQCYTIIRKSKENTKMMYGGYSRAFCDDETDYRTVGLNSAYEVWPCHETTMAAIFDAYNDYRATKSAMGKYADDRSYTW